MQLVVCTPPSTLQQSFAEAVVAAVVGRVAEPIAALGGFALG